MRTGKMESPLEKKLIALKRYRPRRKVHVFRWLTIAGFGVMALYMAKPVIIDRRIESSKSEEIQATENLEKYSTELDSMLADGRITKDERIRLDSIKDQMRSDRYYVLIGAQKGYTKLMQRMGRAWLICARDSKSHLLQADSYHRNGYYDDAIAEYKKAIELDPRMDTAYNYLGVVYYKQGKYKDALGMFWKATSINPDEKIYRKNIETAQQQLRRNDKEKTLVDDIGFYWPDRKNWPCEAHPSENMKDDDAELNPPLSKMRKEEVLGEKNNPPHEDYSSEKMDNGDLELNPPLSKMQKEVQKSTHKEESIGMKALKSYDTNGK